MNIATIENAERILDLMVTPPGKDKHKKEYGCYKIETTTPEMKTTKKKTNEKMKEM